MRPHSSLVERVEEQECREVARGEGGETPALAEYRGGMVLALTWRQSGGRSASFVADAEAGAVGAEMLKVVLSN